MVHRDLIIKTYSDQGGFKCSVFDIEGANLVGTPIYDSPAEAEDEAKKWINNFLDSNCHSEPITFTEELTELYFDTPESSKLKPVRLVSIDMLLAKLDSLASSDYGRGYANALHDVRKFLQEL